MIYMIGSILLLVFLEGMLSFDNAIVLALAVKHLPAHSQRKALTYGIFGAFAFRFLALIFATAIIKIWWLKSLGAAYLIYLAVEHFGNESEEEQTADSAAKDFWFTVLAVEVLDITFSMDSILTAVSVSQNFTVVFIGGVLGIIMMRFAAQIFIKLLDKAPIIEHLAYLLIAGLGIKMLIS